MGSSWCFAAAVSFLVSGIALVEHTMGNWYEAEPVLWPGFMLAAWLLVSVAVMAGTC